MGPIILTSPRNQKTGNGVIEAKVGEVGHPTLGVGRAYKVLTLSMTDDGTYFVFIRCDGIRNERSSGTLTESSHSMCGLGAIPG